MVDYDKKYFLKDGRGFVVRHFDCENTHDLRDLVITIESPDVQRWMDNVSDLNLVGYRRWMDEKGEDDRFLFAIADPADNYIEDNMVHGFVYFYPSKIQEGVLEISYAKRPGAPAGLVAPAIEAASSLVVQHLSEKKPWMLSSLKFLAEIERGNDASIRVIEKAGFTKERDFDATNNAIWMKTVATEEKDKVAVENVVQSPSFPNIGRVRQINGSYCGPSVLQILLSHYGLLTNQEQIAEAAGVRETILEKGISVEQIAKATHVLFPEMGFWVKREATVNDIEKMVREFNYPVGMDWQGIFESTDYPDDLSQVVVEDDSICHGDDGHYSVIVDLDKAKGQVRIMDPYGHYADNDRLIDLEEFRNRWWDDRMDRYPDGGKKYIYENRLMFVVVPKEVRVPETVGMKEI